MMPVATPKASGTSLTGRGRTKEPESRPCGLHPDAFADDTTCCTVYCDIRSVVVPPQLHSDQRCRPASFGPLWLDRGMPACRDPGPTHGHGNDIVEVERQNGRTTGGRATLNLRAIIVPREVLRPVVGARVIQANPPTTYRVRSMRLSAFEVVTHATG